MEKNRVRTKWMLPLCSLRRENKIKHKVLEAVARGVATLLKKTLWHRCFSVNFEKFLRTPFLTEHLWATASEVWTNPTYKIDRASNT